eukprot:TRINITY_DN42488_c0_g1_i1.p1 TRINITY_DN42488_c0_g1~~TRINITY_DN42488_c0_g1_i1.p1  ORF type:complete len:491 (+),score=99.14 TRINITY_DN42488_c0_g1_i1:89-1561(+)
MGSCASASQKVHGPASSVVLQNSSAQIAPDAKLSGHIGHYDVRSAHKVEPTSATACEIGDDEDWSWTKLVLGRYQVKGVDVLGVGNFSVVRRGKDTKDGAEVAVKELKTDKWSEAKFRREIFLFEALLGRVKQHTDSETGGNESEPGSRLTRSATLVGTAQEAQSAELRHLPIPHAMLVQLLGHSDVKNTRAGPCFTVLELGQFTLHDLVVSCKDASKKNCDHSLSREVELVRVFVQLSRALMYIHSLHFIHGDVKPANLMWFTATHSWKLIDLDGLRSPAELIDAREVDFFTPIYAAPELARAVAAEGALRLSRRLDVWSAGIVVLELDMLESPLASRFADFCAVGDDGFKVFMQWLSENGVTLPTKPRAAGEKLLGILQAMLAKDPADRPSPAELLAADLSCDIHGLLAAPAPSLDPAPVNIKPKPLTAWQLFQESHKAELEAEGLKGGKLTQALHRKWKELQATGGEELKDLKRREAELAAEAAQQV